MPAAASVIYGAQFNPLLALKALAYHDDGTLAGLSADMRRDLIAALGVDASRRGLARACQITHDI
jgi:hypothetical protein